MGCDSQPSGLWSQLLPNLKVISPASGPTTSAFDLFLTQGTTLFRTWANTSSWSRTSPWSCTFYRAGMQLLHIFPRYQDCRAPKFHLIGAGSSTLEQLIPSCLVRWPSRILMAVRTLESISCRSVCFFKFVEMSRLHFFQTSLTTMPPAESRCRKRRSSRTTSWWTWSTPFW